MTWITNIIWRIKVTKLAKGMWLVEFAWLDKELRVRSIPIVVEASTPEHAMSIISRAGAHVKAREEG